MKKNRQVKMSIFKSFSLLRLFRSLHGWLGFFVMPWIVVIGLTGIYLNHSKLIYSYLPDSSYDEARFDDWPNPIPLSEADAKAVAVGVWPNDNFRLKSEDRYHDRDVYIFKSDSGRVIITEATGHYWVKTRLKRKTYDPDGRLLDSKIYWGTLFKSLHTAGWVSRTFGTWLADITAGAMVLFGVTGIVLFLSPRLRKRKNKRAKASAVKAQQSAAPGKTPRPQRIKLEI